MTVLRPYQKTGVYQMLRFDGRVLLADEMGLGKTLQALRYCQIKSQYRPILVVCPASAKWVWQNEAQKHLAMPSLILEGNTNHPHWPDPLPPLVILNYDILASWLPHLLKLRPQILIIDEAQYIKNYKAKRTRSIQSLGRVVPRILALSGTPLTNRPKELFSTLRLLCPGDFPSYPNFAWRYCGRKANLWGWDDSGATHLDELHKRLTKTCMIRRHKADVLKDLPTKSREIVPLALSRPQEYARAEKDFSRWIQEQNPEAFKRQAGTIGLARAEGLKQLAAQLKLPAVYEWIDDFLEGTDEKLVVFAWHTKILEALHARYRAQAVMIHGGISTHNRPQLVERFQTDPHCRLFLGNIVAAGTAITLTAASTAAFVELNWVPTDHVQAEDRLHRIGQNKPVNIYYLVGLHTTEYDLCRILQEKAEVVGKVLDGGQAESERLDIFSQVCSLLAKRHQL